MIDSHHDGVHLSVESCPHYLALCAEEVEDGATYFKCCPPIREAANRERLWDGLGAGLIDLVVSDHSPSTPELKNIGNGDFGAAWGGIARSSSHCRSFGHKHSRTGVLIGPGLWLDVLWAGSPRRLAAQGRDLGRQ